MPLAGSGIKAAGGGWRNRMPSLEPFRHTPSSIRHPPLAFNLHLPSGVLQVFIYLIDSINKSILIHLQLYIDIDQYIFIIIRIMGHFFFRASSAQVELMELPREEILPLGSVNIVEMNWREWRDRGLTISRSNLLDLN